MVALQQLLEQPFLSGSSYEMQKWQLSLDLILDIYLLDNNKSMNFFKKKSKINYQKIIKISV